VALAAPVVAMNRPELLLQVAIVEGLRYALPRSWIVAHIPNSAKRSPVAGLANKRAGVLAGMPDLVVFGEAEWGATAYFFEIKAKGGSVSKSQKEVHLRLRSLGFPVGVCRSWEEVVATCKKWRLPLRIAGA
jgi:hypothetical protein